MAIGDSYASAADLGTRLDRVDDGTFTALLDAASRAVEAFTRRQFNQETTATPRRFRAVDCQRLPVDDFHTTEDLAIDVDGTAWEMTAVDPRPWDGIVNGQPGWPFFDLFTINRTWPFWRRRAVITVTAQWGWPAVPEAIRQTTLNVAATLATAGPTGSGGGPVRSEAIDGYSVSFALATGETATVLVALSTFSLASPYARNRFGVA